MLNKDKLRAAFKMFDFDNDGKITLDEVQRVLKNNGSKEIVQWRSIVADIDTDGNGIICFNEFHEMMCALL